MAQYVDIDGVSKKIGSNVDVVVNENDRKIVVDGTDFSVKDMADDIAYLGELSSEYKLEDEPGSMAYENVEEWVSAIELEKLKTGIYDALADIEDETTPFTVEGIVSALYSIKQLVAPDEPPVIGEPDPEEPEET